MKKVIPLISLSLGFGDVFLQDFEKQPPEGFDIVRPDISKGKIDTISYPSKTVGVTRKALIYTPINTL
ncbi:hypothetical protein [Aquiflexum sp.]|uniref:hypothetical protein n=1 Tax=Aquiflexum sp. TaxID=1872584 RepID=UPI003592F096